MVEVQGPAEAFGQACQELQKRGSSLDLQHRCFEERTGACNDDLARRNSRVVRDDLKDGSSHEVVGGLA